MVRRSGLQREDQCSIYSIGALQICYQRPHFARIKAGEGSCTHSIQVTQNLLVLLAQFDLLGDLLLCSLGRGGFGVGALGQVGKQVSADTAHHTRQCRKGRTRHSSRYQALGIPEVKETATRNPKDRAKLITALP